MTKENIFIKERAIHIFGGINEQAVANVFGFIDDFESNGGEEITIVICSEGGDIYSGLALYDRIRQCNNNVVMLGTGMVMSIAAIIFLAGDERYATENTRFMNHQGCFDMSGKVTDTKIEVKEAEVLESMCAKIIHQRTGIPIKKALKNIKIGNDYFGVDRALAEGFIHKVIYNPESLDKS